MALYTVANGNTANATDLNQLVNVLQQPSGGQEKGKYFIAVGVYTSGAVAATYVNSLSRVSVPVSVSIDTADQSPAGGMASPSTGQLSAGGFQAFSLGTTGPNTNARCGGNYTIQY